ncbi:MAG TPA: hypothetical protein VFU65_10835 [Actinocrinis sp.]|nr:hypothetical protein [Actinocrinis sp.]
MHEIDPEETMGPRDVTAADEAMDPEGLDAPNRVAPEDTSAIPSDTQPVADEADRRTVYPDVAPNQASDQSAAPIPDVMGEPAQPTPDVMGAPVPETDETLGDREEADRL